MGEIESFPSDNRGGEGRMPDRMGDRDNRMGDRDRGDRGDRGDRMGGGMRHVRGRSPALTVYVGDRGIDAALRVFKKLVIKEGLLKDLKRREHYEKPGDRKRRKQREAIRRRRRQAARTRGRFGATQER